MSNYSSENTTILAMHEQEGSKRALLLHRYAGDGRLEYVVVSNLAQTRYDGALGYERIDYSWDWGRYFGNDVTSAVKYWEEILAEGETDKHDNNSTCPNCGSHDCEGDFVEIYTNGAVQGCRCLVCSASWDDHYVFDHVANLEKADEACEQGGAR